jgi:hypothetical protein
MKYRKKPVVIEAFQMTQERRMDNSAWPNWLHEAWNKDRHEEGALFRNYPGIPSGTVEDTLAIHTLEGDHEVRWDDWIIRGVESELYPCKPDIFEATYDPAEETAE